MEGENEQVSPTRYGVPEVIMSVRLTLLSFSASFLAMLGCSRPKENLFVWDRPSSPISNLPIQKSATCRFKKGLSVSFQKAPTKEEPNGPERVYYSASNEDETDTVAFLDFGYQHPKGSI